MKSKIVVPMGVENAIPDNRAKNQALPPEVRDFADLLAAIAVRRLSKTSQPPQDGAGEMK